MNDEHLVRELKKGNTTVLKECYSYLQVVKSFILKNSGSEEEAYDIFQEGLMAFYQNVIAGNFNFTSSIQTYIFAICRNIWYQHLRRQKIKFDDQEVTKIEAIDDFDLEGAQLQDQTIEEALKLLNEMGDPCKSVLELFYFKKVGLKEIASKMNYNTEHVVKQRKFRCLKSLKEALQKKMIGLN